ncbi:hypothetical protein E2C01_071200 [Portunus trituberculatus]|uniref:Uncharacterized protein n=1 Tax=Portunus trituberculatus TaxID=210409 RepID=A0A5B7I7C8_PORTR|nr:hypothetical protein [Portunus trituberculatus]
MALNLEVNFSVIRRRCELGREVVRMCGEGCGGGLVFPQPPLTSPRKVVVVVVEEAMSVRQGQSVLLLL